MATNTAERQAGQVDIEEFAGVVVVAVQYGVQIAVERVLAGKKEGS
jgi:hypothetical protein